MTAFQRGANDRIDRNKHRLRRNITARATKRHLIVTASHLDPPVLRGPRKSRTQDKLQVVYRSGALGLEEEADGMEALEKQA